MEIIPIHRILFMQKREIRDNVEDARQEKHRVEVYLAISLKLEESTEKYVCKFLSFGPPASVGKR